MTIKTLLPTAKIEYFTTDSTTRDVLYALDSDWRFARITMQQIDGGIVQALNHYQKNPSPNLIIIQVAAVEDNLVEQLETLAKLCAEGTDCMVIGPENDVQLYRKLTTMGVSDYLVAPINADDMVQVIGGFLLEKFGQQGTQLISVIGAKGGIGTSAFTQLLIESITQIAKQKTLLMDMSGPWGSLPVGLGYEPSISMAELALAAKNKDRDGLSRMIVEPMENLYVAATGAQKLLDPDRIDDKEYEGILDFILPEYPYVVVDLSSVGDAAKSLMIKRSGMVVCTYAPQISSLRVARSLKKEIETLRGEKSDDVKYVMTMQGANKAQEISVNDSTQALGTAPDWIMPYTPKMFTARDMQGKKFLETTEGKEMGGALLEVLMPDLVEKGARKGKGLLEMLGLQRA